MCVRGTADVVAMLVLVVKVNIGVMMMVVALTMVMRMLIVMLMVVMLMLLDEMPVGARHGEILDNSTIKQTYDWNGVVHTSRTACALVWT